jgi:hypothetical protein
MLAERNAGSDIRTSGRKTRVALERYGGKMIGFPWPPDPPVRDHPRTAPVDPDASRPFAERDNGGTLSA